MPQYCYVVIDNHADMTTTNIVSCSDPKVNTDELNESDDTLSLLLQDSWHPVREMPMAALKASVGVLVLLER